MFYSRFLDADKKLLWFQSICTNHSSDGHRNSLLCTLLIYVHTYFERSVSNACYHTLYSSCIVTDILISKLLGIQTFSWPHARGWQPLPVKHHVSRNPKKSLGMGNQNGKDLGNGKWNIILVHGMPAHWHEFHTKKILGERNWRREAMDKRVERLYARGQEPI